MASVKKRNDSPFWICCYRLADGTRKQTSSGLTDKNAALQMALQLESVARSWTREKALELVESLSGGREVVDPTPICKFMAAWRVARERDWSASSRKSFKAVEKTFLSQFGTLTLGKLEKRHLAQYRDHLQSLGRSRRTVQFHIKYLRRVFASAVETGQIKENPASISVPPPRKSRKQPFTLEQFKALLNVTDSEWHNLILIAGLTGQRLRDCLHLQHEQIERDANRIRFRRSKNRDYHFVPLHPAIKDSLTTGFGPVFPDLAKLPPTGAYSISSRFREDILPRIGIVQPYREGMNGNRMVTEFSFHSLRHMLSTELNRMGASPETRMAIVGHDDAAISRGYTHVDFQTAQDMLGRISI